MKRLYMQNFKGRPQSNIWACSSLVSHHTYKYKSTSYTCKVQCTEMQLVSMSWLACTMHNQPPHLLTVVGCSLKWLQSCSVQFCHNIAWGCSVIYTVTIQLCMVMYHNSSHTSLTVYKIILIANSIKHLERKRSHRSDQILWYTLCNLLFLGFQTQDSNASSRQSTAKLEFRATGI